MKLAALLAEAEADRLAIREAVDLTSFGLARIGRLLVRPLPLELDCSRFFVRLVRMRQALSVSIESIRITMAVIWLDSIAARAFAVAIDEVLQSVEAAAVPPERVKVRIDGNSSEDGFVLRIEIEGIFRVVGCGASMRSLLRASNILQCVGGALRRDFDRSEPVVRIVLTIPPSTAGCNRRS